MYKTILFDLDGTLTDPKEGITKSVWYALNKFNINEPDREKLTVFIGPPLYESFMKFYGFSKEQAWEAVGYYREYFSETGIFENIIYDGIPQMLEGLKAKGKELVLATSKPTVFAKQILEHYKLDNYFSLIVGSELDGGRIEKTEVISYVFSLLGRTADKSMVMVGDREHDIIGAKNCEIDSIGVLYGYGSAAEFIKAGATFIVSSVEELGEKLGL